MNDYVIRPENQKDQRELRAVERLTYDAFLTMERPGGGEVDEHLLAHKLRGADAFVPQLDLVALEDGVPVGNIMFSEAAVVDAQGKSRPLLTFGPLSVAPARQGRGTGGALVREGMKRAAALGYAGVAIFGHPGYYPRFGFENAAKFGISTADGENFDAFMAAELAPGSLEGISGRLHIHPVFFIGQAELAAFNRDFLGGG